MEKIIKSLLDQDLYKFSMQQAVLELFPEAVVKYRFMNRGEQRFTEEFLSELKNQIYNFLPELKLTEEEYLWSSNTIPYFKPQFLEYLKNYRFNPEEISTLELDEENNLKLEISGYWRSCILWEVVLMALISEIYFKTINTNWGYDYQKEKAYDKVRYLSLNDCVFSDFGTRRRRSFRSQNIAVDTFSKYPGELIANMPSTFVGTSNVYLAKKYEVKPIGTMSHEWVMGNSVLEGLRNANYFALHNWVRVYNCDLGIALPDNFGLDAFLRNFNKRLARLYDGVRHDSGNPYKFADKIINHYNDLKIDPLSKTLVFSNALTVKKAAEIRKYCDKKIKCAFGIGTFITNDFDNNPPLNMVIKMWECNDIPVIKLSDDIGKECGEENAIKVAKWTFFGEPVISQYTAPTG